MLRKPSIVTASFPQNVRDSNDNSFPQYKFPKHSQVDDK